MNMLYCLFNFFYIFNLIYIHFSGYYLNNRCEYIIQVNLILVDIKLMVDDMQVEGNA